MQEHRDASNRLTFEFLNIESSLYEKVTNEIVKQFELEPTNELVKGLDEIFQEFKKGKCIIGLEWDNWSGYIVNAKDNASESLANEIADFIKGKYE